VKTRPTVPHPSPELPGLGAWTLIRASIDAVPAVKYALGVAGLLAAFAIGSAFFSTKSAAVVAAIIMLVLMVLLLIFSVATKLAPKSLQPAAVWLVWFVLLAFCLCSSLSISSVFFDWPKPFRSLMQPLVHKAQSTGKISLVDVQFLESGQFPKLDLKLRNTGEVAVLKQAIFNVRDVWELRDSLRPAALKASWNYDVELPVLGAPYSRAVPISQSIARGNADRFTFTLGNDAPPARREYIFLITVDLVYDENEQRLSTQPLLFIGPPAQYPLALTSPRDFNVFKRTFEHNLQVIDDVRKFPAVMSPKALSYLNEYSDETIPKLIRQLGDISADTRLPAAGKLGCFGRRADRAVPKLNELAAADPDPAVRAAARVAISEIQAPPGPKEFTKIDRTELIRRKIMWQDRPPDWIPPPGND